MSNPSWRKRFKGSKGFSLIELLVAIGVFAFLVIGVLSMFGVQISSNSYLQHHTKALQLAEDGIELLNRVNYDDELADYDGVIETEIPNYIGYQRQFTVDWDVDISAISVRVSWQKSGSLSNPIVLNSRRVR
jgi:prepilin-type N-terminal cleavage/methylation domain-containing protein